VRRTKPAAISLFRSLPRLPVDVAGEGITLFFEADKSSFENFVQLSNRLKSDRHYLTPWNKAGCSSWSGLPNI
jgi:hypothetical protein